MVFGPRKSQNWLSYTTSGTSPSQNAPTDSAEEANIKGASSLNKADLIEAILKIGEKKVWEHLHPSAYMNRFNIAAGLASIIGFILSVLGVYFYYHPLTINNPSPLLASDIQLRFAVVDHNITEKDLERAPRVHPLQRQTRGRSH